MIWTILSIIGIVILTLIAIPVSLIVILIIGVKLYDIFGDYYWDEYVDDYRPKPDRITKIHEKQERKQERISRKKILREKHMLQHYKIPSDLPTDWVKELLD